MAPLLVIRTLAQRQLDIKLVETPMKRGQSEVGSKDEGIRLISYNEEDVINNILLCCY